MVSACREFVSGHFCIICMGTLSLVMKGVVLSVTVNVRSESWMDSPAGRTRSELRSENIVTVRYFSSFMIQLEFKLNQVCPGFLSGGWVLGINLPDTPWPQILSQVTFGVAYGMMLSLYVLRSKDCGAVLRCLGSEVPVRNSLLIIHSVQKSSPCSHLSACHIRT